MIVDVEAKKHAILGCQPMSRGELEVEYQPVDDRQTDIIRNVLPF